MKTGCTNEVVCQRPRQFALAANEDRFALGGIEERGEALFGIGGRNGSHLSVLDILDKIDKFLGCCEQIPHQLKAGIQNDKSS